jgi:hypothetical protein
VFTAQWTTDQCGTLMLNAKCSRRAELREVAVLRIIKQILRGTRT